MEPPEDADYETARACYAMAYFLIPQLVKQDSERVIQNISKDYGGAFYYVMTCKLEKFEPDLTLAKSFRVDSKRLSDRHEAWIITYPPPKLVNWTAENQAFPLAPWFSAVVRNADTGAVTCWTLGPSPVGGTTLRLVNDEMNANCGPGGEPTLENFRNLIEEGVSQPMPSPPPKRGRS